MGQQAIQEDDMKLRILVSCAVCVAIVGSTAVAEDDVTRTTDVDMTNPSMQLYKMITDADPEGEYYPEAFAEVHAPEGGLTPGFNVQLGELQESSPVKWTTMVDPSDGVRKTSYSIGTTSCNFGTMILPWQETTPFHPVIGQNFYRLKDGRIEQIGQSWLKHGFCALQGGACVTETGGCASCGGGCPSCLGVGCSDPYSGPRNGGQFRLGPRSEVNASTGVFPYPFSAPPALNGLSRRIVVEVDDLDPADNPGALYFAEGQYVHQLDSQDQNDLDNVSYRQMWVNSGSDAGGYDLLYAPSFAGPFSQTQRRQPAIQAWQDFDAGVELEFIDIAGDGRIAIAHKASENDDGTWHYEYAIYNMNSHRSVGSFSVPAPAGAGVSNIGFHDIDSHSGEPYSIADWPGSESGGSVSWATQTVGENPNANAIRWGTTYNFRFDANSAPVDAVATIGLFRAGSPGSVSVTVAAPGAPACGSFDADGDGDIDLTDFGNFQLCFTGSGGDASPGCCIHDSDDDDDVDLADFGNFQLAYTGPM
jgi:hypothetical protein